METVKIARRPRRRAQLRARGFFIACCLGTLAWQSSKPLAQTPAATPDIQGIWNNSTITPLERPPEFAGKPFLSAAEGAEYTAACAVGPFGIPSRGTAKWKP
jgi:hypothetical protein